MSVGLKHLSVFPFAIPGLCVYYEDNQIIMKIEISFLQGWDPKLIGIVEAGWSGPWIVSCQLPSGAGGTGGSAGGLAWGTGRGTTERGGAALQFFLLLA